MQNLFIFATNFYDQDVGLSGKIPEIFEDWLAIENIPEEEALAKNFSHAKKNWFTIYTSKGG